MSEMAELFLTPEETAQLQDLEGMTVNVEQAREFIKSCDDPVERELLWTAFATLTFRMAGTPLTSKFDVLFFVRVLSEMLKDREHLQRVLAGDFTDSMGLEEPQVSPVFQPPASQVELAGMHQPEREIPRPPAVTPVS